MEVEKLIKLGGQLGLQGDALREWVDDQIRQQDERKRLQHERLKEEAEIDAERAKREKELRETEREILRMKVDNPSLTTGREPVQNISAPKTPRLPPFEDGKDLLDAYLLRYERYASVNKWPRSDWAVNLSALLKGKALEVYSRLPEEEATCYDKVKEALLKRYNLTVEGFSRKFRTARPEIGEQMSQFKTRINAYLDKWLELAGKRKDSAEDMRDLFLMEQLFNACSPALAVFLKERKPATAEALVNLAEQYVDAHGTIGAYSKAVVTGHKAETKEQADPPSRPPPVPHKPEPQMTCRNCGKKGHLAHNCWNKRKLQVSAIQQDRLIPQCEYCKKKGHHLRQVLGEKEA